MENKNEVKQQFIELRAKGNSYDSIAAKLSVSKSTLIEWSRLLSTEIGNLKTIETDALLEKHKIAKMHQIETFGSQLSSVRSELDKRDLSNVPTEKLLNMELKLLSAINSSGGNIRFSSSEIIMDFPSHDWDA
mgnify:CR=1 FL=1